MFTRFPALSSPMIRAFTASDGYRLHYRLWKPAGPSRGRIVALHGIQSHSGWYGWSSGMLCAAGWEVWFPDRRGSGMNERDRGHVSGPERLLADVAEFVDHAAGDSQAKKPAVLLSASWGGKLAVISAARLRAHISGLALLYPGIRARVRPRWHQKLLLSLAGRLGGNRLRVPIPLQDPVLFTSNPEAREAIRHDPLSLHTASVGLLRASLELDRLAELSPPQVVCPVLFLLAGNDRIADTPATRRYAERFTSAACRVIEYTDAVHTLEFEACREQFVADLLVWLDSIS